MAAQPADHGDGCTTADHGNGCTTRGYTKIYFQKDCNSMQNYTTVK